MDGKNCLNCMRMVPVCDGTEVVRRECMMNPGMRVNGRMVCEEWRSNDIVGAFSTAGIKTQKKH